MESLVCPNCGNLNPGENQFCQSCGKPLKPAIPTSADKTMLSDRSQKASDQVPLPPPASEGTPPPLTLGTPVPPPTSEGTPPPMSFSPIVPPPPPPAPQHLYTGTPIRNLGIRVDGWSDVVEDAALSVDNVKLAFLDEMNSTRIDGLHMAESDLSSGGGEVRKYQLIYNGKGASVAVRIAPFGKNLVASWDLYTHRRINWLTIGILLGVVFICALISDLIIGIFGIGFFRGFFTFIETMMNWLLVPGLALLLLGKMIKDDWLAYFINDLDEFAAEDAVALSTVVDNALSNAVKTASIALEK